MKKFKFITTTLLLVCIFGISKSNTLCDSKGLSDSMEIKIDTLIAHMGLSSETPGGVVGVIKNGRFTFLKAYGLANFDTKQPNQPSTLFNLASVSKQFAAAGILLLAKENKLSLKDDIRKYLPDFPDYGYTITIENLIHHTSGIRSFDILRLMAGTLGLKETQEEDYNLIIRQKSLNFKPGEEHQYSNSGYILLANIIEKTSGMKFGKFMEEKIFRPIGMNHTFIYDNPDKIIMNRATGHTWGGDVKFKRSVDMDSPIFGPTNVYTCVQDFLSWDNNFYKNMLGKWDFGKEMSTTVTLGNGDTCNYAFGLEVSQYKGLKTISHGGYSIDFTSQYLQIPSEKFAVVCLFNIATDVNGLSYKIADLYVKGNPHPDKASIQPEKANVDSSVLKSYVGKYFDEKYWFEASITREGDHLVFDAPYQGKFEIYPLSDTSFFATVADIKFIFHKDAKGEITKATIVQGNQKFYITYLGTNSYPLNAEKLSQYVGDYYCEDINVTYPVLFKDNKLYIRFPESTAQFYKINVESEFISEHADYFASPVSAVQFTRNPANEVSGFIIRDVGRARNLVFDKVK